MKSVDAAIASMRMEYQLPQPQALQQIGNSSNNNNNNTNNSNTNSNNNNNNNSTNNNNSNNNNNGNNGNSLHIQQQQVHLQLLQQNVQHQQQTAQQQLLGNMQPPSALPSLSSLPLQVVHNLPHLLGAGAGGVANNLGNNLLGSITGNTNVVNLNNGNGLHASNIGLGNGNNGSGNGNNGSGGGGGNNSLRQSMQNVASSQLQQTLHNLAGSNNLGSLPPSSQLLHHHLQHLANVNNAAAAVVAVAANNISNNMNIVNGNVNNISGSVLNSNNNNSSSNNNSNNNNNNNPATPNNNLIGNVSNSIVSNLVGNNINNILGNNNNNNNSNNNNIINGNNPQQQQQQQQQQQHMDDNSRQWTQFQVQQLWKQHASYLNGKSTSNNKEVICGDDKYKEEGDLWNVEAQTAFLGPNLWDKTLPYDADLKVTQYADLDEFLSENNIPDSLPGTHLGHSSGLGHRSVSLGHAAGLSLDLGHITAKRERSPSPSDCISPDTLNPPSPAESTFSFASSGRDFDPRTRAFSDEELKPQPMIKKSRKQFVPDELKDDKYWARRRKNNIAAKRSRDARRQKENQIAMRARYLEKENATLHQEVEQLKQENMDLRARLSKFQDV